MWLPDEAVRQAPPARASNHSGKQREIPVAVEIIEEDRLLGGAARIHVMNPAAAGRGGRGMLIGPRDRFSPLLEPKGVRPLRLWLGSPEGFRGSWGGGRELEHELGAAARGVDRADGAAVLLGDLAHDRQAEPGARPAARRRRRGRSGRRGAAGPRGRCPAPWSRTRTPSTSTRTSTSARRRVAGRVVEQVVDRAREPLARALDDAGSSARLKRTSGAWRCARVDGLGDEVVEPHVLESRGAARRRARARSGRRRACRARSVCSSTSAQQPRALVGRQRLGLGQHLDVRAQLT